MRKGLKRTCALLLTLITLWCGSYFDPAFAEYKKPYYITVDLTNQIVTIYNTSDDTIARQMLCSAGMNDCTPTGEWYMAAAEKSEERTKWYYFRSFNCYAQYASRIFYQYFFHSITFNRKRDDAMSAKAAAAFGNPASHGCIRLRVEDAKFIAENCLRGTRVTIFKSGESDEELRKLLYVSTYCEDEMPYSEFLGISEDALGRGSAGEEVKDLQTRLRSLGYYDSKVDGVYNAETIAAVKQLQKDIGMARNGIVNAALSEVIYSDDAPVSDGLVTVKEGQSGPTVKKLQQALTKLKLYSGEIDGIYDIDVAVAVDLFQTMCGYDVDGTTATPKVQRAIYYEIDRMQRELGNDFTVSTENESVEMATVVTPDKVRINVRSQPDTESEAIVQVKNDDIVLLNAVKDNWAQITTTKGVGYIKTKYLKPFTKTNSVLVFTGADGKSIKLGRTIEAYFAGEKSEADQIDSILASEQFATASGDVDYCKVNTGDAGIALNLRGGASQEAEVLTTVPNGTDLRVLSKGPEWTKVGYDDMIGYLMNNYLTYWTGTTDDIVSTADNTNASGGILAEDGYAFDESGEVNISDVSDENITAIVVPDKKDRSVPVYSEADESSEPIQKVKADEEVSVIGVDEETGWCLITVGGTKGYMKDVNLSFRLGDGLLA